MMKPAGCLVPVMIALVGSLASASAVPRLDIPPCPAVANATPFRVSNVPGDVPSRVQTLVQVCHEPTGIRLVTEARDQHVVTRWSECNDPVFKESATLELFLAPVETPYDAPTWYHEIDCGPAGALWAGVSHNLKGNVSGCNDCLPGTLTCHGRDVFPPWDADGFGVNVSNTSTGWRAWAA